MKNKNELTPLMVEDFFKRVDDYCVLPDTDIADLVVEFKYYQHLCIAGLFDRVYKQHPYNAMSVMESILDVERTKIKRIVYKK